MCLRSVVYSPICNIGAWAVAIRKCQAVQSLRNSLVNSFHAFLCNLNRPIGNCKAYINAMRNKLSVIAFLCSILIGISSCSKKAQLPTPAIDFHESIENLLTKSNAKPFDLDLGREPNKDKETLSYKQQWEQVKYSTEQNDTLLYWFINKELFGVYITSPSLNYNNTVSQLQNTPEISFNERDKYYCNGKNKVFIGERIDGGTFFVYLNDEYNEITDLISLLKNNNGAWNDFIKTNSGDELITRFYLSLMGAMTSYYPAKYYNTILRL